MSIKGDLIESLPEDDSAYNENLANVIFKEQKTVKNVFKELKESIIIALLFVVFSSEQLENIIKNVYPASGNNRITMMVIKCVLVVFFFYLFKNFEFARAK
jgi:hypothetical protein